MSKRSIPILIAALIGLGAFFFSSRGGQEVPYIPPVQGKNNTALFIVLAHHGFSNVHVATAQALLERHPQIDIHFASFPVLQSKLERISASVSTKDAKPIKFHSLPGRDSFQVVHDSTGGLSAAISPPGLPGVAKFCKFAMLYQSPWQADEHFEIFEAISQIIQDVDPSVTVLDTLFAPAQAATRQHNRLHVNISPNTLVDLFAFIQPRGGGLWKYPMMGSGLPFPIPWHLIPSNIYQVLKVVPKMLFSSELSKTRKELADRGVKDPIDTLHLHLEDAPWISPSIEGASIPLDFLPKNVSGVGPMTISVAPVKNQDPELYAWLGQAPTVLINLGSAFKYSEERASIMTLAVREVLDRTDIQILWKMAKETVYSDDYASPLQTYIDSGRLRISEWLSVDPSSVLESGHITAFVHHGGANSYQEGVAAGVPHVVLPMWADLYNYAALVGPLKLGVWGCPRTSPDWTPECISEAILKLVSDDETSRTIRNTAKRIGDKVQADPGRYVAARIVAGIAGSGK